MRNIRIHCPQPLAGGSIITLPPDASHHLVNVLRIQAGQPLVLFNDNNEAAAHITRIDKKLVHVSIDTVTHVDRESPLQITLAIGISKGDRMDLIIQKATELGVALIQPLFTARTEVRLQPGRMEKKLEHWRKIASNACEQCYRNTVPVIAEPQPLPHWIGAAPDGLKLVLHHRATRSLNEYDKPGCVVMLVGPEGGLQDDEIALAEHNGFHALALGPRVLRTETAPLAAVSILQYAWGDFSGQDSLGVTAAPLR